MLALRGALGHDGREVAPDLRDLVADLALVHFHLRLAGVALHGAAAALPVQVRPEALEAGELLLEFGEFDLQHGFLGLRARDEDVQDDFLAVDGVQAEGVFLPIALLRRREFVVEDDEAALLVVRQFGDFLHLAGADEVPRAFFTDTGDERAADLDAEVLDEFVELVQEELGFFIRFTLALEPHQDGPVGAGDDLGIERVEGLGLRSRVGHVVRDGSAILTSGSPRAKRNLRHFTEAWPVHG